MIRYLLEASEGDEFYARVIRGQKDSQLPGLPSTVQCIFLLLDTKSREEKNYMLHFKVWVLYIILNVFICFKLFFFQNLSHVHISVKNYQCEEKCSG